MQLLFYNIYLEHILDQEGAKYILMLRFGLWSNAWCFWNVWFFLTNSKKDKFDKLIIQKVKY